MIHDNPDRDTVIRQLQLAVRGGTWKASRLPDGNYGLVSEAVSPGFEFTDMTLGQRDELVGEFPQHAGLITAYTRDLANT